ncbi:MAG: 3-hydroxyacyl-CoA dehydrogenase family protein [Deltaproteobacteria bacterium]|nr:3-hydroxyacyl-CoA dehydrogenase family protein [Deltaproteobacteria bacterium]
MNVQKITVLGAGTMGHGIAQAAIAAGFNAVLYDVSREFVDKGAGRIRKSLAKRVEKGKLKDEEMKAILSRLTTATDLKEAAAGADFVVEAVPENLDLKKKIFAELDRICKPEAILATNTSVLSVTAMAGATQRKDQVVGTHFFNPAAVMKLVEIVCPIGVSESIVAIALDTMKKMGKVPIRVKDTPGFIVNRLLGPLYMTAAQMVLEGTASAEDIDTAMKLGAGHPMGPCELADFGGFDVIQMAQDSVFEYTHSESDKLNILYRKMIEAGRLGFKNGKGFYDYLPDGTKKPFKVF